MNKLFSLIFLAAATVVVFGCTQRFSHEEGASDREIVIATEVGDPANASKAPVESNASLSGVQFLRVDNPAGTLPSNHFLGATVITGNRIGATGNIVFDTPPTYMLDNSRAFFNAFHPAGEVNVGVSSLAWMLDGGTDVLISNAYDAGIYTAPYTGAAGSGSPMRFHHVLAQLEVVCVADQSADIPLATVQGVWGKITKIELLSTCTRMVYITTNSLTGSNRSGNIPMRAPTTWGTFVPVALSKTAPSQTAVGMFYPRAGAFTLKIYSEQVPEGQEVQVQLQSGSTNLNFEAGKKHTVTLEFKPLDKIIEVTGTTISAWDASGGSGSGNTPSSMYVTGAFGTAPLANLTGLTTAVWTSYNSTPIGTSNSTAAAAMTANKPYGRLDILFVDEAQSLKWDDARTICSDNTLDGGGWRLPRLSELQLLFNNWTALEALGVVAPIGLRYWSADEVTATSAYIAAVNNGGGINIASQHKTTGFSPVRCVRERGESAVLEYGVAPYDITTGLSGATTSSYNSYQGLVGSSVSGGNGVYYTSPNFNVEPPYYKFEVAPTLTSPSQPWQAVREVCWNMAPVGQWRMPRKSEAHLIYLNREKLNLAYGFSTIERTLIWTATEYNSANTWYYNLDAGGTNTTSRTVPYRTRCIRELPAPATSVVLEYGVAPHAVTTNCVGASGASYNSWKGTVAAPTVDGGNGGYTINEADVLLKEPPYYKFEVAPSYEAVGVVWQAARDACWAKTTDGGGWRLPRASELRLMQLNRTSLEAIAGFSALTYTGYHWSGSEQSANEAVTRLFGGSNTTAMVKTRNHLMVARCVREVPVPPTVANPPAASDYVTIDGLKWAQGNLVATNASNAKVGAATDYGLYFHFGSLVGWSGGANGSGVGTGSPTLAVRVQPTGYTGSVAWPAGYYTGGTAGAVLPATDDVSTGIGDPCRVYLGAPWRTPTATDWSVLFAGKTAETAWSAVAGWNWQATPPGALSTSSLFFPASGHRHYSNGSFYTVTTHGYGWSSSVNNATTGLSLYFYSSWVYPQYSSYRSNGLPVRCVSGTQQLLPTVANPPAASDYVTIDGLKWAKGNLVAVNASNAKVGAATDYGLYFHFGSLVGWSGGATGSGVGTGSPALAVQVKPAGYTGSVAWPAGYYTGGTVAGTGYGLPATDVAATGIGDPCRLYLGASWRTPTAAEYSGLFAGKTAKTVWSAVTGWDWQATPPGAMGPSSLFFPASGLRDPYGSLDGVTTAGFGSSSSVAHTSFIHVQRVNSSEVTPQSIGNRDGGVPVRCVSGTQATPSVGVILKYGVAPHDNIKARYGPDPEEIINPTSTSYNSWRGTVADGGNGDYCDASTVNIEEHPYFQFQVSPSDDATGVSWQQARQACWDKAPAGQWRLPRAVEIVLMMCNSSSLRDDGIASFGGIYWSASEVSSTTALLIWSTNIEDHETVAKSQNNDVRCVREVL